MPANGAVYIQRDDVDLATIFEDVKSDRNASREPTYYDITLKSDRVRFNVMEPAQIESHITAFLGYIASLDQDEQRKTDTRFAISHTRVVLGLVTDKEFEDNPAIWESLFKIADAYDGFVFAHGSVLLPNGAVLIGPLLEEDT